MIDNPVVVLYDNTQDALRGRRNDEIVVAQAANSPQQQYFGIPCCYQIRLRSWWRTRARWHRSRRNANWRVLACRTRSRQWRRVPRRRVVGIGCPRGCIRPRRRGVQSSEAQGWSPSHRCVASRRVRTQPAGAPPAIASSGLSALHFPPSSRFRPAACGSLSGTPLASSGFRGSALPAPGRLGVRSLLRAPRRFNAESSGLIR